MKLPDPIFVPTKPGDLPQDPSGRHKGWKFRTLEHDQHTFPHAVEATDAQGRKCVYVPLEVDGKIGRWTSEGTSLPTGD